MVEHKPGIVVLILFTLVVYAASLLINYASTDQLDFIPDDWFLENTETISDKFSFILTPASWTFQIWIFIYIYQLAWIVYAHSLMCRKTNDWQGYLYYRPGHMPWAIYLLFIIAQILNVSWIFTFDREYLEISGVLLWALAIVLYIIIGLSYSKLFQHGQKLIELGQKREIALVRALVQNGLSMYATWVTVASNLGIGFLLVYRANLTQEVSGMIILGALACQILLFYILDWTVMDRFSRYTFTPYMVLIVALSGSINKNWQEGTQNSIFSAVLLGVAVVGFLIKITVVIVKLRKDKEPILRRKGW